MLRAVIDTNLFVRGLLKGPATLPLIHAWKEQRFRLVTSEELLAELFEVLARPKFSRYFTREDVRELGNLIYEQAEVIEPTVKVTLCRDPKDNIFLNVAITGKVPYLVTEDNDLKDDQGLKERMQREYGVQIVGLSEFLSILASIERGGNYLPPASLRAAEGGEAISRPVGRLLRRLLPPRNDSG